ncbi:MAG: carboxypeptidase-like regulatory domain-containing protein, partial [Chryseolinea sp.]
MKKITTILFYSLLFTATVGVTKTNAQEGITQKGNAKISGSVVDTETNKPVEFANVALLDPSTGKPVNGSVADDKGQFSIIKVAEGTYNLSVSFIGYETQTLNGINVDKHGDLGLGIIKIST